MKFCRVVFRPRLARESGAARGAASEAAQRGGGARGLARGLHRQRRHQHLAALRAAGPAAARAHLLDNTTTLAPANWFNDLVHYTTNRYLMNNTSSKYIFFIR